jgi:Cof subfamily protein (haloacid dehalogenase superfamily)
MIKLVASDLDGTLLRNGADDLSPYTLEVIKKIIDSGIHFVAASGRQYQSLRYLFDPIKDKISYIAENGSLCVHNHEVISRSFIPRELGLRIFKAVDDYKDCLCLLSCESACILERKNAEFEKILIENVHNKTAVVDNLANVEEPFLKIAIYAPNEPEKAEQHFRELFGKEIRVVTSGSFWIDFLAPGSNKGIALEALTAHLGLSPSECIAFGDQFNDIDMLRLVKTGYAMRTAAPGVSHYADEICNTVEEILLDILD